MPVDIVAHRLNLEVEAAPLGEGVSGVLVVNDKAGTIGYNATQSVVRQRFTIAHEIGHYILHAAEAKDPLFIDKQYTASYRRDAASAKGEDIQEIQANSFAASLLMPEDLLLQELERMRFDMVDEDALIQLSDKFEVSTQAMSIRLGGLGVFFQED